MELRKELPLLAFVLMPLAYLYYVWNQLPMKVPIHWNINGEADDWTDKKGLLLVIVSLLFLSYIIWVLLLKFGKLKWISQFGDKFHQLRFALTVFISILCLYIVHSAYTQTTNIHFVFILIGSLIAVMGNYMNSLKTNYFIGIRTPWTLKNETVWRQTHQFTSRLWLIGGLSILLLSLFGNTNNSVLLVGILVFISLLPLVYSYYIFREVKSKSKN